MQHTPRQRQGFTIIEATLVVAVAIMIFAMMLPIGQRRRGCGWHMKDSSIIRGVHQSMVQWALQNHERFPLPSLMDPDAHTIDVGQRDDPSQAFKLDSTRNIFSLMVFNGSVPVEMLISPAEQGPIIEHEGYQVLEPETAADPSNALWDPAFRATPRDTPLGDQQLGEDGAFSYAHTPPFGRRRESTWRDTYSADQAVLGNRGPSYRKVGTSGWKLLDKTHQINARYSNPVGEKSNTLLIHGSRVKWEGHIAYQDNRVIFETRPDPEDLLHTFSSLGQRPDNLFANEDETTGRRDREQRIQPGNDNQNAFLRSYSDRIGGSVGSGGTDITVEVFYD